MKTSHLTMIGVVLCTGGILLVRMPSTSVDQTSTAFTASELTSYSKTNTAPKVAKPKHEIKVTGDFSPELLASLLAKLEGASYSTNRVQRIDFRHAQNEHLTGTDSDREVFMTALVQMSRREHHPYHSDSTTLVYQWWWGTWAWSGRCDGTIETWDRLASRLDRK